MWMLLPVLLPFFPLILLESMLSEAFSPLKNLFEKLTEDVDFDRVFRD